VLETCLEFQITQRGMYIESYSRGLQFYE